MKLIAHRGLIDGPDKDVENLPAQIDHALDQGYDAEVDVWLMEGGEWWLGHDGAQYQVDYEWLRYRRFKLWAHCKNLEALRVLTDDRGAIRAFWHQNDDYTLTNDGFIWCYPGKIVPKNGIVVLPELHNPKLAEFAKTLVQNPYEWYGVCTDYPKLIKEKMLDFNVRR